MKIVTVVGARPQFVKAAVVSRAILQTSEIKEIIIHTGQHYDANMSKSFFEQLDIPEPAVNLNSGSGSHGRQTAQMLEGLESEFQQRKPDCVLVYGDTNSTLAGALAAAKLHIPVAHIEAGLRSFNRKMPEEINRVTTDHLCEKLYVPSQTAIDNLAREGLGERVVFSGDVMYDAILYYREIAAAQSTILRDMSLEDKEVILCTVHRAENTDNPARLQEVLTALDKISYTKTVVFPVHPRTKKLLQSRQSNVILCDPLPYLDLLSVLSHCQKVITDSGGLQKEAFWLEKPCITVRDESEWVETIAQGWNELTGADCKKILQAVGNPLPADHPEKVYGDGNAAGKIVEDLLTL